MADKPGPSVSAIADGLAYPTQFVATEIGKLIAKGVVRKRRSEADRRGVLLSLPCKGKTLLRELGSVRRMINDMTFGLLAEERATVLQEILDDLIRDAGSAVHER